MILLDGQSNNDWIFGSSADFIKQVECHIYLLAFDTKNFDMHAHYFLAQWWIFLKLFTVVDATMIKDHKNFGAD